MGLYHLKKFLELGDRAEVVGFFDPHPEQAKRLEREYRIPAFTDLGELLFESDAVVIASPTSTHHALAKQALSTGVHVLVEKPMTETLAEAVELTELARRLGLVLQVGFLERYRCRALLGTFPAEGPFFIEAQRFSTSPGREDSVDVVSDLMIHDLDLALSLVPGEPTEISAAGGRVVSGRSDIASVRMEFADGSVVNLSASRVAPSMERRLKIYSGQYAAHLDFVENSAELSVRRQGDVDRQTRRITDLDALREQALDFIDCIRAKREPLVNGAAGVRALKYVGLIQGQISSRSGERPYPLVEPSAYPGAPV